MSSYNGERFIEEQIDSILNQDIAQNAELKLLVRDDGSKDRTCEILEQYQAKGALTWYTGANLKPAKSFWNLVMRAEQSDYYAFCDQDDAWFSDKLSRAVRMLERDVPQGLPALYCSAVTVTDAALNPIGSLGTSYRAENDFAYSLLYSVAPGCTFVFNHAAREQLMRYDMEQNFELIHDWLAHKIITLKGRLLYDDQPSMYYRQHGNNVIGSQRSGLRGTWDRVRRFLKDDSHTRSRTAQSLLKVYGGDLERESDSYRELDMVAHYMTDKRLRRAFKGHSAFFTGTKQDFFLKCLIIIRKI